MKLSTLISLEEKHLPLWAGISAAIIAAWIVLQSHGVINNDGILYIEAAKQFANREWARGFALYNWPLYPLLIATVSYLTPLEFQASAHATSILFFAMTGAGIALLAKEFGGDRRAMLAAILLLLCSPYVVRSLLPMVIRDHGFLAFHIWSLVFFLRFNRIPSWTNAGIWGVAATIATLFRIEGIIYLAFLPLVMLMTTTHPMKTRLQLLLKAQTVSILIGVLIGGLLLFHPAIGMQSMGRLADPINMGKSAFSQLSQGLADKADIYGTSVLGPFLENFALTGLTLTLALILLIKAAASAGWLQLAFAAYSRTVPKQAFVFKWLMLLGLINGAIILLSAFVLSTRYLLPIATLILIMGAFGLAALFQSTYKNKWALSGIVVALLLQTASTLWPFNHKNRYELEAAAWVKSHISSEMRVYFDRGRLRYYATGDSSNRKEEPWEEVQRLLNSDALKQYDFVLLHVSQRHSEQQNFIKHKLGTPIATFKNQSGGQVQVYRVL